MYTATLIQSLGIWCAIHAAYAYHWSGPTLTSVVKLFYSGVWG